MRSFSKSLFLYFLGLSLFLFLFIASASTLLAACPPGESCPDSPSYCVGPCDAYYDDVNCICIGYYGQAGCGKCGGCFTGETEINIGQEGERAEEKEGETKQIKDLKPGDVVESFNPETGEVVEGTVEDVTKTTKEGYYILETESGEKVKVTGEHPFLAVKAKNSEFRVSSLQLIDKLSNVFSHTLTYRLITGLQAKVSEVLR